MERVADVALGAATTTDALIRHLESWIPTSQTEAIGFIMHHELRQIGL